MHANHSSRLVVVVGLLASPPSWGNGIKKKMDGVIAISRLVGIWNMCSFLVSVHDLLLTWDGTASSLVGLIALHA
jgi:hypothetical protein